MMGKVKVWYMMEEGRLAYIKKYPIVPIEQLKETVFKNIYELGKKKESASK